MKNLTQTFALLFSIGTFAPAAFAAPMTCVVQAWENNQTVAVLAQKVVDLGPGQAKLLYREDNLFYVVNKGENGGLQLSISDNAKHEIIVHASSPGGNGLTVLGSKPMRLVTCAAPTP